MKKVLMVLAVLTMGSSAFAAFKRESTEEVSQRVFYCNQVAEMVLQSRGYVDGGDAELSSLLVQTCLISTRGVGSVRPTGGVERKL